MQETDVVGGAAVEIASRVFKGVRGEKFARASAATAGKGPSKFLTINSDEIAVVGTLSCPVP